MALSYIVHDKLIAECCFSASRSGGPGGQNVNKVNTKVELRFNVENSAVLNEDQKSLISSKLTNRININNEIVLTSSTERSQLKNKVNVTNKFIELITKALTPVKKRKKTKPTEASKLNRLRNKKLNSDKKQLRKRL